VLWLNPGNPETFPPGLVDALSLHTTLDISSSNHGRQGDRDIATRLRQQMKSDALQPLDSDEKRSDTAVESFSEDILREAAQFLRLQVGTFFYPWR